MITNLLPRESPENSKGKCDGGVEMGAGDVTNRVDHNHDNKPPCYTNPRKCHRLINFVHRHRPTTGEHHKKRPNSLCNQLQKNPIARIPLSSTSHVLTINLIQCSYIYIHASMAAMANLLEEANNPRGLAFIGAGALVGTRDIVRHLYLICRTMP